MKSKLDLAQSREGSLKDVNGKDADRDVVARDFVDANGAAIKFSTAPGGRPVEKGVVCGRIIPGRTRTRADGKIEEYHATKGWRINSKLGRADKA